MKNILSFSLWGDNPLYTIGALANAELAQKIYPGWICRFYIHKQSVPKGITEKLMSFDHVEIVEMPEDIGWSGMLWRFYPATESDVDIVLSRDCDSRLTHREKACVNNWLSEPDGNGIFRKVMTIRDTCVHQSQMMGGLWGVRGGYLNFIKPHLNSIIDQTRLTAQKGVDQDFLNSKIYLYSLGLLDQNFNPLPEYVQRYPEFISFDDIAFGKKRFGDDRRRPHDRELMKPTPIQREYGDPYQTCIHCGLQHDSTFIGDVLGLSDSEVDVLDLSISEKAERLAIIKYHSLYLKNIKKYGLRPL